MPKEKNLKTIYKGATVLDLHSDRHQKTMDILQFEDHVELHDSYSADSHVPTTQLPQGSLITQAFTDLRFHLPDPGYEVRENVMSAAQLALVSGFKALCCHPDTDPVMQHKSGVQYLRKQSDLSPVHFYPIGAISRDLKGQMMTEVYDMKMEGAVAFSNADIPLSNQGLMIRSLQYLQPFNGLLMTLPLDQDTLQHAYVHEGSVAMQLGLKGMPSLSEYSIVKRDIDILKYAGGKLHFSKISCAESVQLIREAKKQGLQITCDVSVMHLLFNETSLMDFDTNYKLLPPLRNETDRMALIKGLVDHTIDAICSDHMPLTPEEKEVEFIYSAFGASTLQSLWCKLLDEFPEYAALMADKLSFGPEKVLGLPYSPIQAGEQESLVLTVPETWELNASKNRSLSQNSPFNNRQFHHKIILTVSKNQPFVHV
jgi:dihydroorotase